MDRKLLSYLRHYSTDTNKIDRLLVSTFLRVNDLSVTHNPLLRSCLISPLDEDYESLEDFFALLEDMTFEHLIELFEFVISPEEKLINGAIYTPEAIRTYIVDNSLNKFSGSLNLISICDLCCGCGGFLLTALDILRKRTSKSIADIVSENLFGLDIAAYSVIRTKILLSLYALQHGEDVELSFNLVNENALTFDWQDNFNSISNTEGFDVIVGNPPYVASRNMNAETLHLAKAWSVSATGHPDLYITFFQVSLKHINANGIIGLITVNTFIKSINGRALRKHFSDNQINLVILNFGGYQIFKNRNTYTCICFLQRTGNTVKYLRMLPKQLQSLDKLPFQDFKYDSLDDSKGWNLVNNKKIIEFVKKIENTGKPFGEKYTTKNGIATLMNDAYKFTPEYEDATYYYHTYKGNWTAIEKSICRDILNANKIKNVKNLRSIYEKVIFPYTFIEGRLEIIPESYLMDNFPETYRHLRACKTELAKRDKGNKKYETWYAYGRRQSMDVHGYKLFFPHICEKPSFSISRDLDLLFYNGIAVVSNDLNELILLKKLLETDLFYAYMRHTTKDYSSGYISLSRNYLKNFGVLQLTLSQRKELLTSEKPDELISKWYDISPKSIEKFSRNPLNE